jgi:hypothetical protein
MQPTQRHLLQSIFLEGKPALAAWEQWQRQIDFENLDWDTYQLLPMLHQNLVRHHVRHPIKARLQGVQKLFWCGTQMSRLALEQVVEQLRQVEVEPAILGRAALILISDHKGLQSLPQLDLQVPLEQSEQAIQNLQALGWRSRFADPEHAFKQQPSLWFQRDRQPELVLHRQFSPYCASLDLMRRCWSSAVPDATGTMRVWSATDQLLHGVVQWGIGQSSIVKLANAIWLLQSQPIDEVRLVEMARQYRLLASLQAMVQQLQDLELPVGSLATLVERSPIPPIERWEQALASQQTPNFLIRGVRRYARHSRDRRIAGQSASLISFIRAIAN